MVWNFANFATDISRFDHGGHLWADDWLGENVDGLEAAAAPVPGSLALTALGLTIPGLGGRRRRKS